MPQDENNTPTEKLKAKKQFQTAHDVFAADADFLHHILHIHAHRQTYYLDVSDERQRLYEYHYRDAFQKIVQNTAVIELGLFSAEYDYKKFLARYNEYGSFEARQEAQVLRDDTLSFYEAAKDGTLIPDPKTYEAQTIEELDEFFGFNQSDYDDNEPEPSP